MKMLIASYGLDPNDYWYLKNETDKLIILNKKTNEIKELKK